MKAKIEGGEVKKTPTSTKSSGEVVDLLAALQRSVDAAKTARGEDADEDEAEKKPAKKSAAKKTAKKTHEEDSGQEESQLTHIGGRGARPPAAFRWLRCEAQARGRASKPGERRRAARYAGRHRRLRRALRARLETR